MPTLALWKPYDVLSKFTDDSPGEPRATLADYVDVPDVYGAGRLDRDSEGLLILSDSSQVRTVLTEPRHHVPRTYLAQVERVPDEAALEELRRGVNIKGGLTRPAGVELLSAVPDLPPRPVPIRVRKSVADCWLRLELTEGKNRQVRRMTAAVGHPTLRLVRWAVGPVTLEGLAPGVWRQLSAAEIRNLTSPRRE